MDWFRRDSGIGWSVFQPAEASLTSLEALGLSVPQQKTINGSLFEMTLTCQKCESIVKLSNGNYDYWANVMIQYISIFILSFGHFTTKVFVENSIHSKNKENGFSSFDSKLFGLWFLLWVTKNWFTKYLNRDFLCFHIVVCNKYFWCYFSSDGNVSKDSVLGHFYDKNGQNWNLFIGGTLKFCQIMICQINDSSKTWSVKSPFLPNSQFVERLFFTKIKPFKLIQWIGLLFYSNWMNRKFDQTIQRIGNLVKKGDLTNLFFDQSWIWQITNLVWCWFDKSLFDGFSLHHFCLGRIQL